MNHRKNSNPVDASNLKFVSLPCHHSWLGLGHQFFIKMPILPLSFTRSSADGDAWRAFRAVPAALAREPGTSVCGRWREQEAGRQRAAERPQRLGTQAGDGLAVHPRRGNFLMCRADGGGADRPPLPPRPDTPHNLALDAGAVSSSQVLTASCGTHGHWRPSIGPMVQ